MIVMTTNKYETPQVIVISLTDDVITASLGKNETPREELEW